MEESSKKSELILSHFLRRKKIFTIVNHYQIRWVLTIAIIFLFFQIPGRVIKPHQENNGALGSKGTIQPRIMCPSGKYDLIVQHKHTSAFPETVTVQLIGFAPGQLASRVDTHPQERGRIVPDTEIKADPLPVSQQIPIQPFKQGI